MSLPLRVRAVNTAADSENKIHNAAIAAEYGFRGGLVPGVTVYGYLTAPIVERFGRAWLERGAMQVRFFQPVYDGDDVMVKAVADASSADGSSSKLSLTVERDDGLVCAMATASPATKARVLQVARSLGPYRASVHCGRSWRPPGGHDHRRGTASARPWPHRSRAAVAPRRCAPRGA